MKKTQLFEVDGGYGAVARGDVLVVLARKDTKTKGFASDNPRDH